MATKPTTTEIPTATTKPESGTKPDFEPVTLGTQAELDEFIGTHVRRGRQSEAAKFSNYDKFKADSAELAALKAVSMTKEEKDAARIRELELERDQAVDAVETERLAGLRREICAARSIPNDLLGAVTGDDRESMEASADRLVAYAHSNKPRGPVAMPAGGSGASTTVAAPANSAEAQRQKMELAAAMLRQYYGSGGPGRR